MACENVKDCPCPRTDCANHSQCCICVANHRTRDYPPFCLRKPAEEEKKETA